VDAKTSKLTCAQACTIDYEGQRVSTHHSPGRALDVTVDEIKCTELADVLRGFETIENQSSIGVSPGGSRKPADTAGTQPHRSIEGNITAVQLERETGIHRDGHCDLTSAGVAGGDSADVSNAREIGVLQGEAIC